MAAGVIFSISHSEHARTGLVVPSRLSEATGYFLYDFDSIGIVDPNVCWTDADNRASINVM
jgi:hypothetical protein